MSVKLEENVEVIKGLGNTMKASISKGLGDKEKDRVTAIIGDNSYTNKAS